MAEALELTDIAKADGNYGRRMGGVLVPEVVEYKGLEIGRFEVTRGQFAAFDDGYTYEPGMGNYPVNGVSFERALAYAAWLSELTGEAYRLGSAEEMKAIYKSARGKGNTLDYWAGYILNPDDAAKLAPKIAELSGVAPLLKAVASFPAQGKADLVFDLGGNVAEWAVGPGGGGDLMGGSADLPSDNKARGILAGEAYRGLRVVRDGSD